MYNLGSDTLLRGGRRVGQSVDVGILAADLECDGIDLGEPSREILLPGLGVGGIANVGPNVVHRGGEARESKGTVAAVVEGNLIETFHVLPEAAGKFGVSMHAE